VLEAVMLMEDDELVKDLVDDEVPVLVVNVLTVEELVNDLVDDDVLSDDELVSDLVVDDVLLEAVEDVLTVDELVEDLVAEDELVDDVLIVADVVEVSVCVLEVLDVIVIDGSAAQASRSAASIASVNKTTFSIAPFPSKLVGLLCARPISTL